MSETERESGGRADKRDLVLVHSFYANSILLRGLGEFLSDEFKVYFVDLPGFAAHEPPLAEVSLDGFARHVEERIRGLALHDFLIGGISFGFTVVCRMSLPPGCRGVLAIFPFLGSQSLAMRRRKKLFYQAVVNLLGASGIGGAIWRSRLVERFAFWWSSYPPERVRLILDHMDGRTFFATARLILNRTDGAEFHDRPHILILNPADATVRSDYCRREFEERVDDLCVVDTDLDHYPVEPTADYFRS
ncbi:MAG: alpha/beta hydrolase, partial [Candidatus Aminicenantes bacterium]|nr:alpha/beta hydrolase [Candidatus Aminicenantes bacterium]